MSGRFMLSGTIPLFEGSAQPLSTFQFYLIGTSTPQDTYSDTGLASANANPVVTDAYGYLGEVFLSRNRYKVVWKNASGTTLKTWDTTDKDKIHKRGAGLPSDPHPGQIHDNTSDGHRYERKIGSAAWTDLGTTDSVGNTASVSETLTGTDSSKFVTPDGAAALWQRGTNITPSAGAVTLPSTGGSVFNIAAGNFSSISTAQGGRKLIFVFGGTSVITYDGTAMILPGGASLTTEAGDCACFVNEAAADASGANWRCVWYQRDSTTLAPPLNYAAIQSEMETPTSALRWITPAILKYHPLIPKAWVVFNGTGTPAITASSNVTSITDNGTGDYTINFTTALSSTAYAWYGTARAVTAGAGTCVTAESGDTKTASALQIKVRRTSTDAAFDSAEIAVFVFGDFA